MDDSRTANLKAEMVSRFHDYYYPELSEGQLKQLIQKWIENIRKSGISEEELRFILERILSLIDDAKHLHLDQLLTMLRTEREKNSALGRKVETLKRKLNDCISEKMQLKMMLEREQGQV